MISFGFNHTDLDRIERAVEKVAAQARIEKEALPYRCAREFRGILFNNILTQKYATSYAPYSPRYAEWKTQIMGIAPKFWSLFGDLLNSLTIEMIHNGWFAGLPGDVMDSGGKSWFGTKATRRGKSKPISMYASVMELGLNNHPARPVIGPTTEEYAADGWLKQGAVSLRKIGNAWT
ncbi:MAG: hypothetical protein WA151_02210 [Desulfatirhabdiaceae bacterium]